MSENESYIPIMSQEAKEKGEERICGKLYKKHINENGSCKIYVYTKNFKLWYTSDEDEYNKQVSINQN